MSKEMRDYLAAYLAWVESGAPDQAPFRRAFGLCSNVDFVYPSGTAEGDRVSVELSEAFAACALDPDYPFGGYSVYWDAHMKGTQHENEHRLAWIREQLNRPE